MQKVVYSPDRNEKAVEFLGDSPTALRAFPLEARRAAGYQIHKSMKSVRFANVWDAIEDDPDVAENLRLRAELMIALHEHIERVGMTQARAAMLFGVTQPRISDLMRGKIALFSLDALVNMARAAGLRVELSVRAAS